ncbi:hypothetical protein MUG91_G11n72 [Manis pentadactyla]|nr:hypothetical protein MUG91_G11n72 [Manis pentadactyla]
MPGEINQQSYKFKILDLSLQNCMSTYWNQGYGYQQGYGPGYGGSDDSSHGYYGYGPGYYYRHVTRDALVDIRKFDSILFCNWPSPIPIVRGHTVPYVGTPEGPPPT